MIAIPTITVYAYVGGSWTDITADVEQDDGINASWGISGVTPLDRMATSGTLSFSLRNATLKYTPGAAGALTGWGKGTPIAVDFTFDGATWRKFYGRVDSFTIDAGSKGSRRVRVTVVDWLDFAAKYPLINPQIQANKSAADIITTVVAGMPIAPLATQYDADGAVFPTAFDATTGFTRAYTEINKAIMSEMGYCYLVKDKALGDTLVFESRNARFGYPSLSKVPTLAAASGFVLAEDGTFILAEDGSKIVSDEAVDADFDNEMSGMEISYGDNLINSVQITAYPRRVDTSLQTLFTLSTPLSVASGASVVIKGNYSNPSGGDAINGTGIVTPVATTDYLMNTKKDGTGTNVTAYLVITAAAVGGEGFTYTVQNTYTKTAYITRWNVRGYPIYLSDAISYIAENAASEATYGTSLLSVEMPYQSDLAVGRIEADKILDREKSPHTVVNSVSFSANINETLMNAFLALDCGDLVRLKETQSGIDGWYYIQGVSFTASGKGVVIFTWTVKESLSMANGLTEMSAEFSGATADALNFGNLPYLCNNQRRSWSAWVYVHNLDYERPIINLASSQAGVFLRLEALTGLVSFGHYVYGTNTKKFATTVAAVSVNTWTHIVVTYDNTTLEALPKIYIDGTEVVVDILPASGTVNESYPEAEDGNELVIGNAVPPDINGFDGQIKDVRIYDRILTAAEVASVYSGTVITNGLLFAGPFVRTSEVAAFTDKTLTADDRLIDGARGVVGTASGTVVTRTI